MSEVRAAGAAVTMIDRFEIDIPSVPLPAAAQRWVELVRASRPLGDDGPGTVGAFVESDPVMAFNGLTALRDSGKIRGDLFLEWGSGAGLVAGLAAIAGFRAYGIEIEPDLADAATELARTHATQARFARGSFIPPGLRETFRVRGTFGATTWNAPAGDDPYRRLGIKAGEVDVFFAYPWPREISIYETLFGLCARPGAVLWLSDPPSAPMLCRKR